MLVRVYNQIKNLECYVPAIVEFLPEDQRHPHKFYSVLMFNGQRVSYFYHSLVLVVTFTSIMNLNYFINNYLDNYPNLFS